MKIYSLIIVGFDKPEKDYQILLNEALKFNNYLAGKFDTESVFIIETKDAVKKFKPPNKKEKITNYLREKLKKIIRECNKEKVKLLLINSTAMDKIVNYEYAITHYIVLSWKRGKIYKPSKPRKDKWGKKHYLPRPSRRGKIFDKYFITKQNKKP